MHDRFSSRYRTQTWRRRGCFALVLVAVITVALGAGLYAYLDSFHTPAVSVPALSDPTPAPKPKGPSGTHRINILVLGIDDGEPGHKGRLPARSDTMMVVSLDPARNMAHILSIPRDTMVTIPGQRGPDKVGHAHAYGGPALSVKTVEALLGIPIDYYVRADYRGFIRIVDILGGVDLYVDEDMDYEDPYAGLEIHLREGQQHLDGAKAGQYVRFRHDELGDIGRVGRQQKFLKALAREMLQANNLLKWPALLFSINNYIRTDMTPVTMLKVANIASNLTVDRIQMLMLPGDFATVDGLSYWVPDETRAAEIISQMFAENEEQSLAGPVQEPERNDQH